VEGKLVCEVWLDSEFGEGKEVRGEDYCRKGNESVPINARKMCQLGINIVACSWDVGMRW
jgi:hypothetical protein